MLNVQNVRLILFVIASFVVMLPVTGEITEAVLVAALAAAYKAGKKVREREIVKELDEWDAP